MNTGQIQIRLSLTDQLYNFVSSKAQRLGLPVTQYVKHLVVSDVKQEEYPVFEASARTIRKAKKALEDYKKGKFVEVKD